MKVYKVLGGCCNLIHDKEFPINSIVLDLDGTIFVCTRFHQSRKKPLKVYCYNVTEKWKIVLLRGKYKEIMWDYYRKCNRHHKKNNYAALMRHDRKQKKKSGSPSSKNAITDYECTNNPLHDFRRTRYLTSQ